MQPAMVWRKTTRASVEAYFVNKTRQEGCQATSIAGTLLFKRAKQPLVLHQAAIRMVGGRNGSIS